MKTTTFPQNKQPSMALIQMGVLSALMAALILFPSLSQADEVTRVTDVTIMAYYGEAGDDGHGGHFYKAKVTHDHQDYFIYLNNPLPQLSKHILSKVQVITSAATGKWLKISSDGHSARIEKIEKAHRN